MTHPVLHAHLATDRSPRRWSPRLGYAVAVLGSALVWAAVSAVTMALI